MLKKFNSSDPGSSNMLRYKSKPIAVKMQLPGILSNLPDR